MNLRVAGVAEERAALVRAIRGGDIAPLGVRREIENVAVASRAEQDRVSGVAADLTGHHVPDHDALGVAVDQHQIEHFRARKHLDLTGRDLRAHGLVGPE